MGTRIMGGRTRGNVVASAFVAAILAAIVALSLGAGKAWASPLLLDNVGSKDAMSILGKQGFRAYTGYKKKVAAAKSGNTAVATVKVQNGSTLMVTAKKAGKAKITCTVGGKKKSFTLVVKKYKNPVKTFKVGGKNYASKFKKARDYYGGHKAGKLTIKPASGWKLVSIYGDGGKVKNGKKIDKFGFYQVELKNKKTGVVEYLNFG